MIPLTECVWEFRDNAFFGYSLMHPIINVALHDKTNIPLGASRGLPKLAFLFTFQYSYMKLIKVLSYGRESDSLDNALTTSDTDTEL